MCTPHTSHGVVNLTVLAVGAGAPFAKQKQLFERLETATQDSTSVVLTQPQGSHEVCLLVCHISPLSITAFVSTLQLQHNAGLCLLTQLQDSLQ